MADLGERYTDKKVEQVSKRLNSIYNAAARELQEKEDAFWAGHARRDAMYRAKVQAGKMSQEDYEAWLKGQVFQGKQWAAKRDAIARTMVKADQAAYDIINDGKSDVFAYNANYAGYEIEHGLGADIGFGLYNREAVARIVKDDPDLLPAIDPKKLNPEKDARWYQRVVSNSVTQGIIQGEGIDTIRRRIEKTCADRGRTAAQRDARTAYTGAQNAGRIGAMHQAEDLGLEVKKRWLATLDDKTRDTHRDLDGQEVGPDEPFITSNGDEIMYPGDPHGQPGDVFNCRCRVITVYPKYQRHDIRRDNETGEDVAGMNYRQWEKWKAAQQEQGEVKDRKR